MNRLARYWRAQPLYSALLIAALVRLQKVACGAFCSLAKGVAFAALVVRALIPAGYMPAAGHGLFGLELCTAAQYQLRGGQEASDLQTRGRHQHADTLGAAMGHRHGDTDEHQNPHGLTAAANSHHGDTGGRAPDPHQSTADRHHQSNTTTAALGDPHDGPTKPAGHDSPCLYAATALGAPPSALVSHSAAADAIPIRATREPQVLAAKIVLRSQSARAPPALS